MERLVWITLSLFATAGSVAQPTIMATDAPAPGFTAPIHELFGLPPLASGPNMVWDLTGAATMGVSQLQLAQPSTAPGANNFPLATVVAFADNVQPYNFLRVTTDQMSTQGVMTATPRIYSDPLVTMVFPCTYNTTWTDSYAFPGEQGTRTYLADGHGTLIGPAGSLTDVLKVRSEYVSLDTVVQGVAYTGQMVEDVFWRSGTPWPVAVSFWNRVFAGGQLIEELRVGSALAEIPSSVAGHGGSQGLHIWPNPGHGPVNMALEHPGPWSVSCVDAMGREVFATVVVGVGGHAVPFDPGPLASGRYLLRVWNGHGAVFHAPLLRE